MPAWEFIGIARPRNIPALNMILVSSVIIIQQGNVHGLERTDIKFAGSGGRRRRLFRAIVGQTDIMKVILPAVVDFQITRRQPLTAEAKSFGQCNGPAVGRHDTGLGPMQAKIFKQHTNRCLPRLQRKTVALDSLIQMIGGAAGAKTTVDYVGESEPADDSIGFIPAEKPERQCPAGQKAGILIG